VAVARCVSRCHCYASGPLQRNDNLSGFILRSEPGGRLLSPLPSGPVSPASTAVVFPLSRCDLLALRRFVLDNWIASSRTREQRDYRRPRYREEWPRENGSRNRRECVKMHAMDCTVKGAVAPFASYKNLAIRGPCPLAGDFNR